MSQNYKYSATSWCEKKLRENFGNYITFVLETKPVKYFLSAKHGITPTYSI